MYILFMFNKCVVIVIVIESVTIGCMATSTCVAMSGQRQTL